VTEMTRYPASSRQWAPQHVQEGPPDTGGDTPGDGVLDGDASQDQPFAGEPFDGQPFETRPFGEDRYDDEAMDDEAMDDEAMDDEELDEGFGDAAFADPGGRGGRRAELVDLPEVPELLEELIEVVERAKSMPLSSSAIISRDEVLGLLVAARDSLPVELVNARRMLRDHEELRMRAQREAAEVLDEARSRAQYIVQRTEVVRQARHQAERIVADAEADARRIRHEANEYVDRKLASFESVLDRMLRRVRASRQQYAVLPDPLADPERGEARTTAEDAFFDQDLS
jgi:vacuolar-type H+-ATPase subunit H